MPIQHFHSLINHLNSTAFENVGRLASGNSRAWFIESPSFPIPKIRSVGIIGAGVMGSAIAAAHIQHGVRVVICDTNEATLAKVYDTVEALVADSPSSHRPSPMIQRLIQPTTELAAVARCDLILESIAETLSAKQKLLAQIGSLLGRRTIVASNTSTIPISQLAAGLDDPSRFCGMHFFHPVARRPLVEVVCGPKTSEYTLAAVVAHVKAIQRRAIVADDGPGFIVNRLLFPYLAETLELLCEGVAVETIESMATHFGMAMGPLQLMDEIGLDTTLQAGWVLATAFPERIVPSPLLVTMVKSKQLGCKSGAGFFLYGPRNLRDAENASQATSGSPELQGPLCPENPALAKRIAQWSVSSEGKQHSPQAIADRLLLPMILEATRLLEEGKVLGPADIDHGSVLGLGFPAWRGGLLRWADTLGAAEIIARLRLLDAKATRYQSTAMLAEMAEHGGLFYPEN